MYEYVNVPVKYFGIIESDVDYIRSKLIESDDKLKDNYSSENFYKDEILFASIIYINDEPFQASTVIARKLWNNGCRVLNRLMVVPKLRSQNTYIPTTTLTMLKEQIKFAQTKFDYAFISRELNTYRFVKRFAKDAGKDWQYETDKYLVCEEGPSCAQHIAWTNFNKIQSLPLQSVR